MVFDIKLGKVMESVMKDAKRVRKSKKEFATMTDHFDKQLYYVLTSDQFDLIKSKFAEVSQKEENPAHYCMGGCGKYLGFRGFCSDKCHDEHYNGLSEQEVNTEVKK